MTQATGIEASFITSWEEWDDLGEDNLLLFYNVKLKQDVFPFTVESDVKYDFVLDLHSSTTTVYAEGEPVFTSKFKAVLV